MITLNLELPKGTPRTITVKGCYELTLKDWKDMTPLKTKNGEFNDPMFDPHEPGMNRSYRIVELFTGLSQKELDRMPSGDMKQILDLIGEHLALAQNGSDEFIKACQEDNGFTPPKKIRIAGKKFIVPHDLSRDTVWGQWRDWAAWTQPEHEADLVAEVLLFMLVEEGQEYGSFGEEKTSVIWQCPMMIAFELCAFFFASSAEFRSITDQRSNRFRMWTRHMLSMALKISPNSIEALTDSLTPPRSQTS